MVRVVVKQHDHDRLLFFQTERTVTCFYVVTALVVFAFQFGIFHTSLEFSCEYGHLHMCRVKGLWVKIAARF